MRYLEKEADVRSWFFGSVFLLGGLLTVAVLLMTHANLSPVSIRSVMLPGTSVGMLLMLVGWFGFRKDIPLRD